MLLWAKHSQKVWKEEHTIASLINDKLARVIVAAPPACPAYLQSRQGLVKRRKGEETRFNYCSITDSDRTVTKQNDAACLHNVSPITAAATC